MESWKTIKREQVLDLSPFLKVEQHTVVLPDGQVIEKVALDYHAGFCQYRRDHN